MHLLESFKQIKAFIFDLDGVLTDGGLYVFPDGKYIRKMNIKDGIALQLAVKKGYHVAVISGSHSDEVVTRLNKLGVRDVFMQESDKVSRLKSVMERYKLDPAQVLFMGDDIPDYSAMQKVGMPCAPADAATEIKTISKYISWVKGGEGCARDVIEKVLKLNGHWELETDVAAK